VITTIVVPIVAVGLYLGVTSYLARRVVGGDLLGQPASIEEAIAKIEVQLATHPDDATGWRMLGRSRVMTSQYAQAVTAYDKAIALTGGRSRFATRSGRSAGADERCGGAATGRADH
jgi:cytochrome c-type biogenesis protein CcmH